MFGISIIYVQLLIIERIEYKDWIIFIILNFVHKEKKKKHNIFCKINIHFIATLTAQKLKNDLS